MDNHNPKGYALVQGFVYLDGCLPNVRWDAKYAGADNFVGEAIDGYRVNRVVGSLELGERLKRAAERAENMGLGLLLWDAYRPQRAVDHFVRWTLRPENGKTKARHYPRLEKNVLIEQGYIAARSGHSRGGTVDLTLCSLKDGAQLDMGGYFDLMDESSHHGAAGLTKLQEDNRYLLKGLMEACGFRAYSAEWWHYTMANEPYPDTYFDFVIE